MAPAGSRAERLLDRRADPRSPAIVDETVTILAHRIRLDPNNVQQTWFARCAGTARFAWNYGLARWNELRASGEKPSWQAINAELNACKAERFPWMLELPWAIPNKALSDLGSAFQHFFRRVKAKSCKPGRPRFKKRGRCSEGFTIEGRALTFDGKTLRVPKLGLVRLSETLRFSGKIVSARFTKRAEHWYVSIQVEIDESRWSYPHRCETQAAVGIDLGVRDLAVLSTGERIVAPRALRKHEIKLRRLNKELARRTKGGKNWQKTKAELGRLHERIANIRRDVTHKLTARLVSDFRWIGIEDLNVKGMARTRRAKSVMDAAMAEVGRQLAYKAPLAGGTVVVADRWFPSSKRCSACGVVRADLMLQDRRWTCTSCETGHDRDDNAAENLRQLAAAYAVTACRQGSAGVLRGAKLPFGQEAGGSVNFG